MGVFGKGYLLIWVNIAKWVVTKWAPRCESKSDDYGESEPATMFPKCQFR